MRYEFWDEAPVRRHARQCPKLIQSLLVLASVGAVVSVPIVQHGAPTAVVTCAGSGAAVTTWATPTNAAEVGAASRATPQDRRVRLADLLLETARQVLDARR